MARKRKGKKKNSEDGNSLDLNSSSGGGKAAPSQSSQSSSLEQPAKKRKLSSQNDIGLSPPGAASLDTQQSVEGVSSAAATSGGGRAERPDGSVNMEGPVENTAEPRRLVQPIPALQEEVIFYEGSIRSLTKRNEIILSELSRARSQQKALELRQAELLERKIKLDAARAQHLSLQQELHESLSRSRDRLGRLMKLDDDEDEKEDDEEAIPLEEKLQEADPQGISIVAAGEEILDSSQQKQTKDRTGHKSDMSTKPASGNTDPLASGINAGLSVLLVVIAKEKAILEEFGICHRPENLLNFLPCIGSGRNAADLVEQLMTVAIRDATSLDQEAAAQKESSRTGESHSSRVIKSHHRRESLWNTCLDFLQLSEAKGNNVVDIDRETAGSSCALQRVVPFESNDLSKKPPPMNASLEDTEFAPSRLDPNFSLCPYELAGVCADDFCPYQHVNKEALVQRERLPLPPLRLSKNKSPQTNKSRQPVAGRKQRGDHQKHDEEAGGRPVHAPPDEVLPTGEEQELEKHPVIGISEMIAPPSLDDDDNSALAKPYREGARASAVEIEAGIVDQNEELEDGFSDQEDIDEFLLDFVALPPAEDISSDEAEGEEEAASDEENAIVSTFLDDVVQSTVTAGTMWWNKSLSDSHNEETLREPESVTAWLDDVAGFHVVEPAPQRSSSRQGKQAYTTTFEYRHDPPRCPLDYIRWFGRVVDASRVAIHAGRFDIVKSLMQLMQLAANATAGQNGHKRIAWGAFLEDQGIEFSPNAALSVLGRIEESAFHYDNQPLSCFHSAFGSQISLAIVSEAIRYTHDHYSKIQAQHDDAARETLESEGLMEWGVVVMPLIEACLGSAETVQSLSTDVEADHFTMENVVKGLRSELYLTSDLEPQDDDHPKNPFSFDTLMANVIWALRISRDRDETHTSFSVDRIDDGILKPSWSVVKNFFRRSIGSIERPGECLRSTIMMGYIILGSLQAFVKEVRYGGDDVDSNTSAALAIVDTTIFNILVEWSDLVADVPLLEMLLSPLFGACVATAVFLRNYAKAQHRLESLLGDQKEPKRGKSKIKRFAFTKYSELLWSQLVQLRFSLPSSTENPTPNINSSPNGKERVVPWGITAAQILDCKEIASCIASREVALHHVCLAGDWNLTAVVSNRPFQAQKDKNRHHSFHDRGSSLVRLQQAILDHKNDVESQEGQTRPGVEINLSKCPFVNRRDSANGRIFAKFPLRSTLPQSILLAGRSLTSLNLEGCMVNHLPASFGMYFTALVKLDLSGNRLQHLPDSLGKMVHLQHLLLESNELQVLPSVLGQLRGLKRLLVADNLLEQLPPSIFQCSNLEELQLHHNYLWIRDGEEDRDKVTAVKLTLRLHKLRSFQFQPQKVRPAVRSIDTKIKS